MSLQKSEIKLEANGKPLNAYLASPSSGGPGVLVLPSWFGLKPYFKQVCDRLAEQGYTALGLDYYDGRIGTTVEEAQVLQEQVESDLDAMAAMVKAAKDHLVSLRTGQACRSRRLFDGHGLGGDHGGKRAGCCCDRFVLWRMDRGFQQYEIQSSRTLCRNRCVSVSTTDEWHGGKYESCRRRCDDLQLSRNGSLVHGRGSS